MKQYKYKGKSVSLRTDTYQNNGTLAVLSDSMAFLDTNNYPGIDKWIEKNGLGLPMGVQEQSGFCQYPLYTLFIPAL